MLLGCFSLMLRCVTQNTWETTICINFTMLNEFKRPALQLKRRTHKMSGWLSFTLYFIEVVAELSLSMDVVSVINRRTVKFNYSQIRLPNHSSMFGWKKAKSRKISTLLRNETGLRYNVRAAFCGVSLPHLRRCWYHERFLFISLCV